MILNMDFLMSINIRWVLIGLAELILQKIAMLVPITLNSVDDGRSIYFELESKLHN